MSRRIRTIDSQIRKCDANAKKAIPNLPKWVRFCAGAGAFALIFAYRAGGLPFAEGAVATGVGYHDQVAIGMSLT
jgi:hypothetical protein